MNEETRKMVSWYEQAWLDETEKSEKMVTQLATLQLELAATRQAAIRAQQVEPLERECTKLHHQVNNLKTQLEQFSEFQTVQTQLLETRQKLERLQRRFQREDFWHGMAEEFSESLEAFEPIFGSLNVDQLDLTLNTIRNWHIQLDITLEQALTGQAKQKETEHARRILIAHWVLLRWLEVSEVVQ